MCANDSPAARCFWNGDDAVGVAARVDLRQRQNVAVRVPRPLGDAGGAAGEDDGHRVVGSDARRWCGGRGDGEGAHGITSARAELFAGDPDDVAQLRQVGAQRLDRGAKVGVVPRIDGDQQRRSGAPQDVADLGAPVARIDARGDRAEARGGEVRDEVERSRRQQQGDDAAVPDAARRKGGRQAIDEMVPVAVRQPLVAIAKRLCVGRLRAQLCAAGPGALRR